MKIGLIGDVHLTNKPPGRRIDNWWETQKRKLSDSISLLIENGCDCILQTGDLVDSPGVSNVVISEFIDIVKKSGAVLNAVAGNHCLWGHSYNTLPTSPLSVFKSSGAINILGKDPMVVGKCSLYGAGFGEDVPEPHDGYNVLVIHKMIGNRPLYPDQELIDPINFLKNHPGYNLVVAGDYHYRFVSEYGGRIIINPGAMVRKSISKWDLEHRPAVVVFDTDTGDHEVIDLKFSPASEVFDLTTIKEKDKSALKNLIDSIGAKRGVKSNWKSRLVGIMNEMGCNKGVRSIIDEAMSSNEVT